MTGLPWQMSGWMVMRSSKEFMAAQCHSQKRRANFLDERKTF
jgi:hypothetical protein